MDSLVLNLTTAVLMVLAFKSAVALVAQDTIRSRRVPWGAVGLTLVALVGVAVLLSWPGAMAALDDDPSRAGWQRVFTSVFLQQGIAGTIFNVVTLAVVAALAEWF